MSNCGGKGGRGQPHSGGKYLLMRGGVITIEATAVLNLTVYPADLRSTELSTERPRCNRREISADWQVSAADLPFPDSAAKPAPGGGALQSRDPAAPCARFRVDSRGVRSWSVVAAGAGIGDGPG